MGDPGCTCHDEPWDVGCPIHDGPIDEPAIRRPLTTYELDALEALDTGPRRMLCCLAGGRSALFGALSTFELHQVEATDLGVVRWWRCQSCGALRLLDSVARPIELTPAVPA